MSKGRKPKPTRIKEIEGNAGKRPLREREPKPRELTAAAPKHLRPAARQAWKVWATQLQRAGVVTEIDAAALEVLCEAYADLREARAELKRFGADYYETTNQHGSTMYRAHPALAAVRDADRRIRAWLSEFGMTPSARSRVDTAGDGEEDPAAEFFS
ncbi:MAG: phage terminase small subunit P27 family [Rhizobiales bacterium]|nr:phage terminase small subunit P27 family [Hyphomicrobiales bacterium]